ncbi:ferroxidase HEPHL1-like isoform X1 [Hoplias malabaricus]|uniref:ferroxidase HEPHL1-like isoform X1 n=1 Tax=Hoplias malabaricus TaxID=27720 RepID=UPI003463710F
MIRSLSAALIGILPVHFLACWTMTQPVYRLCLCFLIINLGLSECAIREYNIGIREEDWDYAPSGKNQLNGLKFSEDENAALYLVQGPGSIGSIYKKAVYRQYTDRSFSVEMPKPDWLGFLGPVIRAEVGDDIVVHLKNFASQPYSLHPHGVFYKKDSEGALYPDGTSGKQKKDDAVRPGEMYTYRWKVTPEFAPMESDSGCLTWIYHSHVDAPKDIATGLIGVLLTCKKGALDSSGLKQSEVDQEFFLMFSVVDENFSWYLDENIQRFCPDCDQESEDENFEESNLMHSINGFVYGNLPTLSVCLGNRVSWHLFGIGNEIDIHTAHFHGHTLLDRGHRTDVLSLFPASFVTAEMVPKTLGKWLLSCQVNDHMQAGMQAFYEVSLCGSKAAATESPGRERHYFIAAEEQLWDYAPSGKDVFTGKFLTAADSDSEEFFTTNQGKLGGKYYKARYVAYTDSSFNQKIPRNGSEQHLGILGPVIRAETGDVLVITFKNLVFDLGHHNFSLQPHGLHYDKRYEGSVYQDGSEKPGSSVAPGETFIYRWTVREGPSPNDPPCLSYLYFSGTDPAKDTNSGLVGPLQVCRKGVLDESGRQHLASEVQKEFFLLFSIMDENESWFLYKNSQDFGSGETDFADPAFQESNKMHSMNGFMYGNLPALDMFEGDHVVWHTLGLGTEVDMHGVYFEGNTFKRDGTTRDTLSLFPHTSVTISMTPDNHGSFELSCRTTDHHRGGMKQFYTVKQRSQIEKDTTPKPNRVYYIAAEEVVWNYAPNRTWELEKHNTTLESSPGSVYLKTSETQIGPEYKKVVFQQYTDDTFTTKKLRGPEEEHLGILGPILKMEVGDLVQIVFKNKASGSFSVHAHGVKTDKTHQTPVSQGKVMRYNWKISAGPGQNESKCITYAYYSSVNFIKDLASGLVGPLVVCVKGTLDSSGRRKDVNREFALLFMVFDENESWFLDENIRTYLHTDPSTFHKHNDNFTENNLMHAINGKLYGNLHGLEMKSGDRTEWYLIGLGNERDMHTVHFHAQSFIYKTDYSHRADVFDLFPGTFQTVELVAGTPGTWLLHCHVTDHIHAGMETTFTIHAKGARSSDSERENNSENGSRCVQCCWCILLFISALYWLL